MLKHSSRIQLFLPHGRSLKSTILVTTRIAGYAQATPRPEVPQWPQSPTFSPYELFNTTPENFDLRRVREQFIALAKVYHPDSTLDFGIDKLDTAGKAERFKRIVAAYDILKDKTKKYDYDHLGKGWEYGNSEKAGRSNFYGRDFSKAARYRNPTGFSDQETGTSWDDYHQDYREYQRNQDPNKQKEDWERHKKMIAVIALLSFILGGVQMKFLMNGASKDIEGRNKLSGQAQNTVYLAMNNYGHGDQKDDRIKRFLAHREGTYSYDNYKELSAMQEQQRLALPPPSEPK